MSSDDVHVSSAVPPRDAVPAGGQERERDPRKPYSAPQLILHGSVRELTLGAGGVSMDANSTATKKSKKKPSDPSVKQRIVRIGTHPLGIGLYLFEYKRDFLDDHRRHFGVMADEVEQVMPEAVSRHESGVRQVNHALLGISDFAQQLDD
jgi:hypothetical protein